MKLLYKPSSQFRSHFSRSLSTVSALSTFQTSLFHSKLHPQGFFNLDQVFLHLVRVLILLFHAFDLTFWDFLKILGFFKIDEVFVKIWDGFCIFDLKTSCITSHLHHNNVSCILRYVFTLLQTCVLVGLDWTELVIFLLLHITCSYIFVHTYLTFSIFLYIHYFGAFLCVSFSPSLSSLR